MSKLTSKVVLTILAILAIITAVGYSSFQIAYHYTSTPEFCSSCHYLKPYVTSWSKSPHKGVTCMACHEPLGPLGKIHSKARGLNYYLINMMGEVSLPLIKAAYIDEQNCFGCHTGQNSNYQKSISIKSSKDHLKYVEENSGCSTCHSETGHESKIGITEVFD